MKIASERMRDPVVRRHYAELAARLYASVGRKQITVDFLKMMVDHMEDPRLKEELLYKYRIAVNERDLEVIDFAIERYLASQKSCPSSMDLLVKEGYLLEIPQDPFGQGYYINKDNCKAATYAAYETMKKVFIFKEEEMHERGD